MDISHKNKVNQISNGVKCDIVIPVWNELEITKNCIESIISSTRFPHSLIIIDNGSNALVADYLNSLRGKIKDLSIITNQQNLGYVKAINQGFKESSAEFVCLLNNDTIVTDGWLSEMVDIAYDNVGVGIVNPSSNTLAQSVPKGQTIQEFAGSLKASKGSWGELGQCSGFCMLIKREVIEKIGLFDESYEIGYFEETDYCRRVQNAGYQFARAKRAYVYHLDRVSFDKRPDKEELFRKNRELFEHHWGESLRIAYIIANPPNNEMDKHETEQIILTSAKDSHKVCLYIKRNLLSRFDIAEHSNIWVFKFNPLFFPFICFFKIITKKRKKRFNLIITNGRISFYILKVFCFIHKAKIMFNPHLERAIEESQKNKGIKQ